MKTVQAILTVKEVAERFLFDENLCAISWKVMDELANVYRKYGSKEIVYMPKENTYILIEKEEWEKVRRKQS